MNEITIDYQNVSQHCDHCQTNFDVSRGAMYENGKGFAIYLAALHQCLFSGAVHLAIAVKEGYQDFDEKCAAAIRVYADEHKFQMTVVDRKDSPWSKEPYLGKILGRNELLKSPMMDTFYHLADHIVVDNPTIYEYLTST